MPNTDDFENRLFTKGQMDTDTAPEYVENGSYGYAFNIRPYNPASGSVGVITNTEGNTEVEYSFDMGENPFLRVIGSKLDLKRNRVYWCIYGQTNMGVSKAFVLYYDYTTQDIVTVFNDPNTDFQKQNVLEFSKDGILRSIQIIYDDLIGDTLLWTDGITEPKKLNVKASIARFNHYTTKTTGFVLGDIKFADINNNFYKNQIFIPCRCIAATNTIPSYNFATGGLDSTAFWEMLPIGDVYSPYLVPTMFYQKPIKPYFSPISKYNYDEEGEVSGVATFLRRRSFQFCYKYVYFDGQESEWSPISEAVFSNELTSAIFSGGESELVDVDFPIPKSISVRIPIVILRASGFDVSTTIVAPHSMISRVKVAIRNVPNSIAPEDWYQFADIQYSDVYKHNVSPLSINTDFQVDAAGTYFYNWDTNSFKQAPGQVTRVTTITVEYDGSQTLIPIDVLDTSTLYYNVPTSCISQSIIDNRVIYGAGKFGMNVSNNVIKSIENNLSMDLIPYDTNFNVDNQTTAINAYLSGAMSQDIIDDGEVAYMKFMLGDTLNEADFNTTFYYNFSINIDITYKIILGYPASQTISVNREITGKSAGIPEEYATFKEFLEDVISNAYSNVNSLILSVEVDVNETTGELTISFIFNKTTFPFGGWSSINSAFIHTAIPGASFYKYQTYLPERTFKNHSKQQYAIAFFDPTGRVTNVIAPDNLGFNVDHFVSDSLNVVSYKARLSGLADITVPTEAAGLQILRKRSESYSNYIQFCISRDNCPTQSWNSANAWVVGFVNLELDETTPSLLSNNQKNLYITLNSVNGGDGGAYESLFNTQILDFSPQEGDVVRFLYRMNDEGEIIERYNASFSISNYSELWNTIVIDFRAIEDSEPELAEWFETAPQSGGALGARIAVEVIKKGTVSEQDFYYEVAAQYSCSNGSVDVNPNKDAIFLYGDTYLKVRGYCIDYNRPGSSSPPRYQNFPIQDKNYNDFTPSANQGTGSANAKLQTIPRGDNYFRKVDRDNLLTYSEQSIQNTDVRKYGTVYDANIQEVDNIYGRIEYLHAEGDTLYIFQEDKRSRIYAGRTITTELSGADRVIASQNQVFSDVIYQKGNYGISKDATSFATNGYQKYYTDSKRGNVYRESLDGITVISEIGMSGYFKNIFKAIRNSYTPPIIRGVSDNRTDEYILSVTYSKVFTVELIEGTTVINLVFLPPEGGSYFTQFQNGDKMLISFGGEGDKYKPKEGVVLGNQESHNGQITVRIKADINNPVEGDFVRIEYPVTETLVYSERTGGWTTMLSYNSEWMSDGIQSYVTFNNGQFWLHDLGNTNYNTFHGRTFDSSFEILGNQQPQLTKFFKTLGVKANLSAIEIQENDITTSEEQVSHIPNYYFLNGRREGTFWANFLGEGEGTEVLNGDRLKGRWLKAKITLTQPEINENLAKVFGVVINSHPSNFTI